MNIEVEVKVKANNFPEIKKNVSKIGKLIKSIKQIDEYYVPCHRDFFAKKPKPTEWLRIRTNPDKVIFEYDRSINIEIALDDVKDLGFFVEAEAKGDFADEKEAKKACIDFLEKIGIKDVARNQIKSGYPQLYLKSLVSKV